MFEKISNKIIALAIVAAGLFVAFLITPIFIVIFSRDRIVDKSAVSAREYALVLGAGLNRSGEPSDMLADRLDVAVKLYKDNKIKKIIVSGDNSTVDYNEPVAMAKYLVANGVPESAILRDYAGRRTYDSCLRLKRVWKVDEAIIVTQTYHLYRSLWLCEKSGIDSVGVSASLRDYQGDFMRYVREIAALYRAWFDVFIYHPKYIPGNGAEFEEGSKPVI
ncbi:MAG: ElyC/SanA/YdcF family protein [bacterium]